ncbi:uncharacterized protein N7482_006431 [Penicillium canariense]|uniref:Dolichyl-diphosphooligosaccharide--protein glycosyltransferase subunit 4 n=1 Tax=Penicillium canariense TaxID=189055 RepID=A0A9W9HUZ8_9EURO|nr:uncharacterized protein N7482_006431 [Penicillium canariense]KAJ5159427.1 hypothetical protein N7482_006431 [Penicillium canariense]
MISDGDLYRLAIFLGSCAMMMIVLYHFLDVNAQDEEPTEAASVKPTRATAKATSTPSSETAATSSPATRQGI